ARMDAPAGVSDDFWAKLAEKGWLGMVLPEEYGGSGLGFVVLTVLMEEMGRCVMPGPFFSTVLLGGLTILEAGSPAQRKEWLPKLAAGQAKATLALTEPNARWDAAGVTATAKEGKGGFALSGTKLFVHDAHLADVIVDVENAKSLTYYAAWAADENSPETALATSMAKAYVSDAYRKVSAAGIQLHGGIGFTWEHDLHLYFKRAKASEFTFGDATHHRERVAQLIKL